jgi:hypothetical protein
MRVSSEVKRTLVKSPPELWSELSDAELLGRHLGDLGEIRIKRIETERAVDWEADGANGSVRLEPSGFGTRVTLSLTREPPEAAMPPEPVVEPDRDAELAAAQPTAQAPAAEEPLAEQPGAEVEPEPASDVESQAEPIVEVVSQPESPAKAPPEARRGFFARLFRRKTPVSPEPASTVDPDEEIKPESAVLQVGPIPRPESVANEPQPAIAPEPAPAPQSEPEPRADTQPARQSSAEVAVDLAVLEEGMAEQDAQLLTAMLDRLGAAHHRPFSRS